MNLYSTSAELRKALAPFWRAATSGDSRGLTIADPERFRREMLDGLVWTAVFAPAEARDEARRAIREAAEALGILPASILPLYEARGRGEVSGFTVPAINVRMLSYDTARAACRAAREFDAGAVIFEIARSEMGYTEQRPAEYASVVLAAAIREEWSGPFFLQGDHFQTNPKKIQQDAEKEIAAIEALIEEAIPAGFFQIDIDTSTLVDLSQPTLEEQQRVNAELCARFTKIHPVARAAPDADLGRRRDRRGRQGELDAGRVPRVHGGVPESARRDARASPRSRSRRAPRTAASSRPTARSSASRSTSPS